MDHYIQYANLPSTLDLPMTDIDLLSALTSHIEPRIQGPICGNFRNTQDTLAFLAKYQGLAENSEFCEQQGILGRGEIMTGKRETEERGIAQR
jgi:hypothetical protein